MTIKEVTPATTPVKPIPQKTSYHYAGKESLGQIIGKAIPEQLIPTKRIGAIFGAIFILVLIIAAFQFPFSKLMSGNIDLTIKVGYPWTFLELELKESDIPPIKTFGLIFDLLLYIAIAYGIDIALNSMLKNPLLQKESRKKQKLTTFKDRKPTVVEKVAEKITEKITSEKIEKEPLK